MATLTAPTLLMNLIAPVCTLFFKHFKNYHVKHNEEFLLSVSGAQKYEDVFIV
jgi:hypothetical protein